MASLANVDGSIIHDDGTAPKLPATESSAVMHRSLHHRPLEVKSAQGNHLFLNNGQAIFDATGGAAVSCLGHGNERVRNAIIEQMDGVAYCHSLFYSTAAAESLAQLLIDSTDGEMSKVFFTSSGSEATEAALKMARQYHLEKQDPEPERVNFIARYQSYHGTTLGALSVGGHHARRSLFEPILSTNSSRVEPCYAYRGRDHDNITEYAQDLAASLDAEIQRLGPKTVAAFVAEPWVGAALGCVPPEPGYFEAVQKVCDKHGVLLVLDEIMCGIGRVGPKPSLRFPEPLHAWQDSLVGVVPDIQTIGKGLGGGYVPLAAMLVSKKVAGVLERGTGAFSHGQTFQGHPLACRAALEVQKIIREGRLADNVRQQGELIGRLLEERLAHSPIVGDVRGQGLFWGIEFVADKKTKEPFEPSEAVAMMVHNLGMQEPHNISLYPGTGSVDGRRGDHVIVSPAYNITSQDVDAIVDRVCVVIDLVAKTLQKSASEDRK